MGRGRQHAGGDDVGAQPGVDDGGLAGVELPEHSDGERSVEAPQERVEVADAGAQVRVPGDQLSTGLDQGECLLGGGWGVGDGQVGLEGLAKPGPEGLQPGAGAVEVGGLPGQGEGFDRVAVMEREQGLADELEGVGAFVAEQGEAGARLLEVPGLQERPGGGPAEVGVVVACGAGTGRGVEGLAPVSAAQGRTGVGGVECAAVGLQHRGRPEGVQGEDRLADPEVDLADVAVDVGEGVGGGEGEGLNEAGQGAGGVAQPQPGAGAEPGALEGNAVSPVAELEAVEGFGGLRGVFRGGEEAFGEAVAHPGGEGVGVVGRALVEATEDVDGTHGVAAEDERVCELEAEGAVVGSDPEGAAEGGQGGGGLAGAPGRTGHVLQQGAAFGVVVGEAKGIVAVAECVGPRAAGFGDAGTGGAGGEGGSGLVDAGPGEVGGVPLLERLVGLAAQGERGGVAGSFLVGGLQEGEGGGGVAFAEVFFDLLEGLPEGAGGGEVPEQVGQAEREAGQGAHGSGGKRVQRAGRA